MILTGCDMKKKIAILVSDVLFKLMIVSSYIFEEYDIGIAYDVYIWAMRKDCEISDKYGLNNWVSSED